MFLKASALSFALLLLSRLLGLVRESALAAAFGTSGMADIAVLMLTLPDLLTGVIVSGALSYVLLPEWATQTGLERAQMQARMARRLLALGVIGAAMLYAFQELAIQILANGLQTHLLLPAMQGLIWAACALPAALLTALWITRLQFEQDFVGMYVANLVISAVVILACWLASTVASGVNAVTLLGIFMGIAMGLRLLWLRWRLERHAPASRDQKCPQTAIVALPPAGRWLMAGLTAGLPLVIPFAARSFASSTGEGALSTFNYAWKLVELPLVTAIQLVAALTFPAIVRSLAIRQQTEAAVRYEALQPTAVKTVRGAFLLAWTLACAAVAALQIGAPTLAILLFGWGRMPASSLATVAQWGQIGSWSLLPQALTAVALTVLAAQGRMHASVVAYALAVAGLLAWGSQTRGDGYNLMVAINVVTCAVSTFIVLNLQRQNKYPNKRHNSQTLLPWQGMAVPAMTVAGFAIAAKRNGAGSTMPLGYCVLAAISVVAISYLTNNEFRSALRR